MGIASNLRLSEIPAPSVLEKLKVSLGEESMGLFTVTYGLHEGGIASSLKLCVPLADEDVACLNQILKDGGDLNVEPYLKFALMSHPGADPGKRVGLLGVVLEWKDSRKPEAVITNTQTAAIIPGTVETADDKQVDVLAELARARELGLVFMSQGKLLEIEVAGHTVSFELPVALLDEHLTGLEVVREKAGAAGLSQEDGVIVSLALSLRIGPEFDAPLYRALFG